MRYLLLTICCGAILFFESCEGCKENNTPINFNNTTSAGDSTYVLEASAVPAADPHSVLIEEFTGQDCSSCPAAHAVLENLVTSHPGRVNVVGMYIYGPPQAIPPAGSVHDFRDSTATTLSASVYGAVSGIPSGGVDRIPVSGSVLCYSGDWPNAVDAQLATANVINLSVQSTYNATGNEATITAQVIYTSAVSVPQNLSIVIVEDSMTDLQANGIHIDAGYLFRNVYRAVLTDVPFGNPLTTTAGDAKEKGRVFRRIFTYKPKTDFIPAHCRVVAFVSAPGTGTDYTVYQSAQTKLVP
jgi:hypothetical protein